MRGDPNERDSLLGSSSGSLRSHKSINYEEEENDSQPHTQRRLKARHLSMIAIGGTIGSGLFLGSGSALSTAGPAGALIGFFVMGIVMFSVTSSLGEMCAYLPIPGSFTNYATRFVDPALGFATGWNYWYNYAVTLAVEISAAAIVISYWKVEVNVAVWIAVFFVASFAVNLIGADAYGEAEFWMAIIKVLTVVGLLILGVVLIFGGGPTHEFVGFKYWKEPGAFNTALTTGPWGYALGVFSVFIQAAFSYQGTEIVAVTAGEAQNPTKTLPKAIKSVFFRILLFYMAGVFIIGMLVPYNDDELLNAARGDQTAAASPFVIFINRANIKVLPDIINAVILTAALSAANSDLYTASRTLYALAIEHKAPQIFTRCNSRGLPYYCVLVTGSIGLLGFLNVASSGAKVFTWLYNFSTVSGLFAWVTICISYIRFHSALRYNGVDRSTLPYKSPLQPYSAWFGLITCSVVIVFNGFTSVYPFNWANFATAYSGIPIFFVFYLGYKLVMRTSMVPLSDIDLSVTKGYEVLEEEAEEDSWLGKILEVLV